MHESVSFRTVKKRLSLDRRWHAQVELNSATPGRYPCEAYHSSPGLQWYFG
jgi:hypothetical protein